MFIKITETGVPTTFKEVPYTFVCFRNLLDYSPFQVTLLLYYYHIV